MRTPRRVSPITSPTALDQHPRDQGVDKDRHQWIHLEHAAIKARLPEQPHEWGEERSRDFVDELRKACVRVSTEQRQDEADGEHPPQNSEQQINALLDSEGSLTPYGVRVAGEGFRLVRRRTGWAAVLTATGLASAAVGLTTSAYSSRRSIVIVYPPIK